MKGRKCKLSLFGSMQLEQIKGSRKRKIPKGKRTRGSETEGKHLWNGCGSEAGKSERKRTAKLSTGIRKEGTGNQAGEKEETEEARAETGHRESNCEAAPGRKGKEEQRLSSQNPKLRRTKECQNSGGQKAERKQR